MSRVLLGFRVRKMKRESYESEKLPYPGPPRWKIVPFINRGSFWEPLTDGPLMDRVEAEKFDVIGGAGATSCPWPYETALALNLALRFRFRGFWNEEKGWHSL